MKRRMVGAGGMILVIALVAIGGWYLIHTRSTASELNKALAEYESRKPVSVTFVVTAPENTPADQTLYLSGSVPVLGNWDAAGVPLKKADDGKFHATVPDLLNTMEYAFKVTRGTWGTVEADDAHLFFFHQRLGHLAAHGPEPDECDRLRHLLFPT